MGSAVSFFPAGGATRNFQEALSRRSLAAQQGPWAAVGRSAPPAALSAAAAVFIFLNV